MCYKKDRVTVAYRTIKRAFDIVASFLGIVVTLPVWLIAIIGIEVSDPGPVFYVANRIGKDNKAFRMFKFRSMRVDKKADERSFKAETSRIFPFGALIRRLKIDELPQLLNILVGDMSVVGPRPAAKDQLDTVRAGRFAATAEMLPGLTGPGALYDYIYGDTVEDEAEYREKVLPTRLVLEVYYVRNKSVLYDIRMIWYTVVCVVCSIFGKEPKRIFSELLRAADLMNEKMPETANAGKE